jgi:hypothetical protein
MDEISLVAAVPVITLLITVLGPLNMTPVLSDVLGPSAARETWKRLD